MNNFIDIRSTRQLSSTSDYHVLQSSASIQPSSVGTSLTVLPVAKTTTEGPIVLKAALLPEDYEARIESFRRFLDSLESGAYMADDITAEY